MEPPTHLGTPHLQMSSLNVHTEPMAIQTNGNGIGSILNFNNNNDEGLTMKIHHLNSLSSLDASIPASPSGSAPFKRNTSYGNLMPTETKETRVRVIYTGGTIGMMRNEKNVLAPIPNAFLKRIRKYPNMHDEEYAQKRFGQSAAMAPLVLPYIQGESNRQTYEFFDGFVVLHGTDTLSYTASALSFMLENLGKTVIITGSQIPIFETRTDGKDNFTSALIIAGNYVIPEVCVFFGNKLMRGNRTVKVSSNSLDAFDSPNVPPLAHIGINVDVDYRLIFRPCKVSRFTVHSDLDENVGILRIFPSISTSTVKAFLTPPMKGVVLQSFGSGNVPANREDLLQELKGAADRGVIIINCTQCPNGSVAEIYQTGQVLVDMGVLPGFDMTPEAALTKLSYVLGKKEWSLDIKKQMMQSNLRGELTSNSGPQMEEYDLVDAVARSLHLSSPQELSQLGATLFPAMLNAAVIAGDIQKINNLKAYGADLSGVNSDNRTALHLACHEGNMTVVNHLLLNGVSVHIRDRYERTPLLEAIATDNHEIIKLLRNCGAHLTGSSRAIGEQLCAAAARNSLLRLQSYQLAGADLSQPDTSRRTALHVAAAHGHEEIVRYLLNYVDTVNEPDMLGLNAMDYAQRADQQNIIQLLKEWSGEASEKTN
uniref:asparaginase n=1 Tax=Glossina pallidipes TaxID=7398 RepID=A0A1B0A1S8_GLOPL